MYTANQNKRVIKPFDDMPAVDAGTQLQAQSFTRMEVHQMFGGQFDRSVINKDAIALGCSPGEPLSFNDVWEIYLLRWWMAVKGGWRQHYIRERRIHGVEYALHFMKLGGGSREHFEQKVRRFIEEYRIKPLKTAQVEGETIDG